jgi:hypothetical protein
MQAFHTFWSIHHSSFFLVNQAYMILLCKRQDAVEIKDFRPINLIHCFSKLMAKVLSLRLDPHMSELIRPNQNAFIHGRAIHDNFHIVQSTTAPWPVVDAALSPGPE